MDSRIPTPTISPRGDQYRRWALILFSVLAAVAILVGVILVASIGTPNLAFAIVSTEVALAAAPLIALIVGLRTAQPWAIAAIAPTCTIVIVAGLLRFAAAIFSSSLTIPLEAVAAILVLSRYPRAEPRSATDGRGRWRTWLVVGAFLASMIVPYVLGGLARGPR